jgi:hypothetical protein
MRSTALWGARLFLESFLEAHLYEERMMREIVEWVKNVRNNACLAFEYLLLVYSLYYYLKNTVSFSRKRSFLCVYLFARPHQSNHKRI